MAMNGVTVRRRRRRGPDESRNKENETSLDSERFASEFRTACSHDKEVLALSDAIMEASMNKTVQIVLVENIDMLISKARYLIKKAVSQKGVNDVDSSTVVKGLTVSIHILRAVWTLKQHRDLLIRLLYHTISTALEAAGRTNQAINIQKLADCGMAAMELLASALDNLILPITETTGYQFSLKEGSLFPIPQKQRLHKRESLGITLDQVVSIGIASLSMAAQLILSCKMSLPNSRNLYLSKTMLAFVSLDSAVSLIESLVVRIQSQWILALADTKPDAIQSHMKQSKKILSILADLVPDHKAKIFALIIEVQTNLPNESSKSSLEQICRAAVQYAKLLQKTLNVNRDTALVLFHNHVGELLQKKTTPMKQPFSYVEYCAYQTLQTNFAANPCCDSTCCFKNTRTRPNHICGPAPATCSEHFLLILSTLLQVQTSLSNNISFSFGSIDLQNQIEGFMECKASQEEGEMFCKFFAAVGLERTLHDCLNSKHAPLGTNVLEAAALLLTDCVGVKALHVAASASKPEVYYNLGAWSYSVAITALDIVDKPYFDRLRSVLYLKLPAEFSERLGRSLSSLVVTRRDRGKDYSIHMSYALAFLHQSPDIEKYQVAKRLSVLSGLFADEGDTDKALLACVVAIMIELTTGPETNKTTTDTEPIILSLCQRCSGILIGECPSDEGNKVASRIHDLCNMLNYRTTDNFQTKPLKGLCVNDAFSLLCTEGEIADGFRSKCCVDFSFLHLLHAVVPTMRFGRCKKLAFIAELMRQLGHLKKDGCFSRSIKPYMQALTRFGLEQAAEGGMEKHVVTLCAALFEIISTWHLGQMIVKERHTDENSNQYDDPLNDVETSTAVDQLRIALKELRAGVDSDSSVGHMAAIISIAIEFRTFDLLRHLKTNRWLRTIGDLNLQVMCEECLHVVASCPPDKTGLNKFTIQCAVAYILRLGEIHLLCGEDIDALSVLRALSGFVAAQEHQNIVNASTLSILASDRVSSGLIVADQCLDVYEDQEDELLRACLLRYKACTVKDVSKLLPEISRLLAKHTVQHNKARINLDPLTWWIMSSLLLALCECHGRCGDSSEELGTLLRCLDMTKRLLPCRPVYKVFDNTKSFYEQAIPFHLCYRWHDGKIDCLYRIADSYFRLGDFKNCVLYSFRFGDAFIGSNFSTELQKTNTKWCFDQIFSLIKASRSRSLQDNRWKRQLLRLFSYCFPPTSVANVVLKLPTMQLFTDARPVDFYYQDIESFKDSSEVRKILYEHDFSNASVLSDVGQPRHCLPWDGSDHIVCRSNLFSRKGLLPQLSCDQRLDLTMYTLTKLMISQIPGDQRVDLEENAVTVGCNNTTRCWSLYLRGLMELEEAKVKGVLMRLWKEQSEERNNRALSNARGFLEQALTCVGSSVTDLKRKVQRSLALALGPTGRSNALALTASDLIQQSLNEGTTIRLKSQRLECRDCDIASQGLNELKAGLPKVFRVLAVVSCPTGEVLLDMLDGSQELKTCCIFPSSAEHVADSMLRPLHELLASSDKQLDESMSIDRQDAEAKRRWRRARRELDKSFQHFMRITAELFTYADLPLQCRDFLFDKPLSTPGNLCSRFDKVAADEVSDDIGDEKYFMILLLDEKLQKFPFESLYFFEKKTICRLPSLIFVHEAWQRNTRGKNLLEFHHDRVTYILNPEGDLSDTEERLLPALRNAGADYWTGYVKQKPHVDALEIALSQKNGLLMYFGHGGGERVITKEQLANLGRGPNGIQSSVILMGCSSGELQSPNQNAASSYPRSIHFEPDGLILRYLLHGAPCVVGNLWDVTDRDIDIFTQTMLHSIFKDDTSIAESLATARSDCKFRYLTGAAPVCYGLPVYLRHTSLHG